MGDEIAGKVVRGVHQVGDDASSQVDALEEVKQGRSAAHLGFNSNSTLRDVKLHLSMLLGFATREAPDRVKGFFVAILASKQPRRSGGKAVRIKSGV